MSEDHPLDAVFEHVKTAIERLNENDEFYDPQKARRILQMILPRLAFETLKNTGADFGSPHMKELTDAINNPFKWENELKRKNNHE